MGEASNSLWLHQSIPCPEFLCEAANMVATLTECSFALLCETHGGSFKPLFVFCRDDTVLVRNSEDERRTFKKITDYLEAALGQYGPECFANLRMPKSRHCRIPQIPDLPDQAIALAFAHRC